MVWAIAPQYHERIFNLFEKLDPHVRTALESGLRSSNASSKRTAAGFGSRAKWGEEPRFASPCRGGMNQLYIGNWSDYEEMMMEKFGKDLPPHLV